MGNGQTELDRYGCEFGRGLAKDVANLREDMTEVKQDVKTLLVSMARIEESVQSGGKKRDGGTGGSISGRRGSNREFWASVIALAIALVTLATTMVKVW